MGLNKIKGNMYDQDIIPLTHTWNTVKGKCFHDCSYCYMKRWGNLKEVRFDRSELKTDLDTENYIFVGSSCDMWAEDIESIWIYRTLQLCQDYFLNKYFFQTKHPERFLRFEKDIPKDSVLCTTIETNRNYRDIFGKSPEIMERVESMNEILSFEKMITIEPILDFDLADFVYYIKKCNPSQVNIGADSRGLKLPEPSSEKIHDLINELKKFTTVKLKKNLKRIYNV
jgi:DNA repair photolyase